MKNLKIITAEYLLVCDEDFTVIRNGAVCFEKKIIDVGTKEELIKKYAGCEVIECGENSVLMPGLINTHVHLEFSANKTTLSYGSFIKWLESVIQKREDLLQKCDDTCIKEGIDQMLEGGTTAFGAISSFGLDLEACKDTPQKVIYFNEVLGSRPDSVDVMFDDFKSRLRKSVEAKSGNFIPAMSVHASYSTHPILAKNALDIARKHDLLVSTHFMESIAEKEWLENGEGDFVEFFNKHISKSKPLCTPSEYIDLFEGVKTLFVHAVLANEKQLEKMSKLGSISHCPVSNRLLNNPLLDLQKVKKTGCNITIGTDGLSSNISLNLWDELRYALMMHGNIEPNLLSKELILAATKNGAEALELECGSLSKGKDSDIIVLKLPDCIENEKDLPIQLILHTQKAEKIYINGEEV